MKLDKQMDRLECVQYIIARKDAAKRPRLLLTNSDNLHAYDACLNLHNASMVQLKAGLDEVRDKDLLKEIKKSFRKTVELLDIMNEYRDVASMRRNFASATFVSQAVPYGIFLLLFTIGTR